MVTQGRWIADRHWRAVRILLAALVGTTPVVTDDVGTVGSVSGTASVTTYRGDPGRTGGMPGPAPVGAVRIAWRFAASDGLLSSPLVIDGQAIVLSRDGVLTALSLADGSPLWSTEMGTPASSTPLIANDLIIVGDDENAIHAYDIAVGQERWSTALDGPATGAAALGDGVVVHATASGSVFGIEPVTGTVRWRTDVGGEVSNSVAAGDGIAYVGVRPATVVALATSDGSELWRRRFAQDGVVYTPTVADGVVFASTADQRTGTLVTIEPESGELEQTLALPDGVAAMTPAVVEGKAYVARHDGVVERIDVATGDREWSVTTPSPILAMPAVAGEDLIVVGLQGPLWALDIQTGGTRWSMALRGEPYAPVVVDGLVLVPTDLGILYAIAGEPTP